MRLVKLLPAALLAGTTAALNSWAGSNSHFLQALEPEVEQVKHIEQLADLGVKVMRLWVNVQPNPAVEGQECVKGSARNQWCSPFEHEPFGGLGKYDWSTLDVLDRTLLNIKDHGKGMKVIISPHNTGSLVGCARDEATALTPGIALRTATRSGTPTTSTRATTRPETTTTGSKRFSSTRELTPASSGRTFPSSSLPLTSRTSPSSTRAGVARRPTTARTGSASAPQACAACLGTAPSRLPAAASAAVRTTGARTAPKRWPAASSTSSPVSAAPPAIADARSARVPERGRRRH